MWNDIKFSSTGEQVTKEDLLQFQTNLNRTMRHTLDHIRVRQLVETLEVGSNVIMGPNATISWEQVSDQPTLYTDTDAINAINATYIDGNGVWTPQVYAQNINTTNAKITNAQIENVTADQIVAAELSAISANLGTITAGSLTAITLSSSTISGGTIAIGSENNIFKADSNGIYLGDGTFESAPFRVTQGGAVTMSNATVTGNIVGSKFYGSSTNSAYMEIGAAAGGNLADFTLKRGNSVDMAYQIYDNASMIEFSVRPQTTTYKFMEVGTNNTYLHGTWDFTSATVTGGVKKIYVQSTAPTDTTGIWIDTN